jgi:hypothetical protein
MLEQLALFSGGIAPDRRPRHGLCTASDSDSSKPGDVEHSSTQIPTAMESGHRGSHGARAG